MAGIQGAWNIVVHTYMGDQNSLHEYEVDGGVLTGTITDGGNGNKAQIREGKVDGDHFSFQFTIKIPIGEMEFTMDGALQADGRLKGNSSNAMGSFEFEGTRV